jgi:hypothetical protein
VRFSKICWRQVGPLIRGPVGSKVELEILSPGATQIRKVVLTRQKILQAGPAPLEPRQVKSIRDTLSDGAQKAVKHLQKMAQAAAETMQVKEEDDGYDPEAVEIVNRMQISAPFNYRVRFSCHWFEIRICSEDALAISTLCM